MTKKTAGKGRGVGNYKHGASRRTMIPTAEQQGFVEEDEARPTKLRYPRNLDLDPQLVWRGKDLEDDDDLHVDAPPVYIQEKIHPRQIIERMRRETRVRRETTAEIPDLFADFNGRPEEQEARTEFYQHEQNWQNRMILGDALMVMASLAERENLRSKVQCIYMDPPYGIKFNSNWQASTKSRNVKDGSLAHVSREPEQIKAFRDTWKDGINSYLSYLRDRLTVARDLLAENGSIFVQIGDENVHRVRVLMDEVFGEDNFVSQICFRTTTGLGDQYLDSSCNYLIWHAKDRSRLKYREIFRPKGILDDVGARYRRVEVGPTDRRPMTAGERASPELLPNGARIYRHDNLTSQSGNEKSAFPVEFQYGQFSPGKGFWKTNQVGMQRLKRADRIASPTFQSIQYVRFLDDFPVSKFSNVWTDTQTGAFTEDKIYVVQTNGKVAERCILMTTDPGDVVLDPTCGSGTTAHVAEQWGRRWITIDTSRVALALARARIMGARYPYYLLKDSEAGKVKEAEISGEPLSNAAVRDSLDLGFVYRRVPHITLKTIANNAEIDTVWEQLNPAVEDALDALNAALAGQEEPFPVTTGARAGESIDFAASCDAAMLSGGAALANGFMEWEVPRNPGTPWAADQCKLHAEVRAARKDERPAKRRRAERALAELNAARGQTWTFETLPERAETPWPDAAEAALETFWKARIALQSEIDVSILSEGNRNAEYLYDRPYEDPNITRVAGPFTVESLSPYRVIPSDDAPAIVDMLRDDEGELPRRVALKEETDFARVVMEHLKSAGVQNTKKGERLQLDGLQPWPGKGYVAFEGRYEERGDVRRAAVAIGPEWDAVGYEFVRAAAREARDAFDILVVCGFQFAPEVDDSMLNFGRLKVLKARMNQDIRMGDKLKNTGAGNLFVVFGEPDIAVHDAGDDMIRVELGGVDIFDPTTGEVKSSGDPTEDIACWFIDDDYDQESFFVRQAYFLGGASGDPYKSLKRALRAEIDEEAWKSLHTTMSLAFPKPENGRICVKVINHFGDEVQKVYSL